MPSVVLLPLLFISLDATVDLRKAAGEDPLKVRVVGHQWWWEVEYPDFQMVTANEIHVPVGRVIEFELRAADVIHSFWVPNIGGKLDLFPDHSTFLRLKVDRPGNFRGQCAEFCGLQHALMGLMVIALPEDQFEHWLEQRLTTRTPVTDPEISRGKEVFFENSCNTCHAIVGTTARGKAGPDLTHIGSRTTLGAATLFNNRENLADWIANPQAFKPGNLMPPTEMSPDDLDALSAYMKSLQ